MPRKKPAIRYLITSVGGEIFGAWFPVCNLEVKNAWQKRFGIKLMFAIQSSDVCSSEVVRPLKACYFQSETQPTSAIERVFASRTVRFRRFDCIQSGVSRFRAYTVWSLEVSSIYSLEFGGFEHIQSGVVCDHWVQSWVLLYAVAAKPAPGLKITCSPIPGRFGPHMFPGKVWTHPVGGGKRSLQTAILIVCVFIAHVQ